MRFNVLAGAITALAVAAGSSLQAQANRFPTPLPEEPLGMVAKLPATYPDSFVFVTDLHFNSLIDGRAAVVDVSKAADSIRGQIRLAQFGNILVSPRGSEIYTAETFFSRMTRGERSDVVTIWDKSTLEPKGEIILPGNKRGHFVTQKNALQFTNGEKWALVYNFTPAASVTVVDLAGRKALGEVSIPGCALAYPTGARGFSSLCADGSWLTVSLDESGAAASTKSGKPMIDIDRDPWFMIPAVVDRKIWFTTFLGGMHGFDMSGEAPRAIASFKLAPPAGDSSAWRPSGWQVASADPAGLVYVLMNPDGKEGSHKSPGTQVWVADTAKKAVVRRIKLQNAAVSIEVTQGASPLLVAAQQDGDLDIYDATTGDFHHGIAQAVHDPMTMSAAGK